MHEEQLRKLKAQRSRLLAVFESRFDNVLMSLVNDLSTQIYNLEEDNRVEEVIKRNAKPREEPEGETVPSPTGLGIIWPHHGTIFGRPGIGKTVTLRGETM